MELPVETLFPVRARWRCLACVCQLKHRRIGLKPSTFFYLENEAFSNTKKLSESSTSLMHLCEGIEELNPDEKTRLLINLIDDIHDCAVIMQHRSLAT